jgi:hypothetical protein
MPMPRKELMEYFDKHSRIMGNYKSTMVRNSNKERFSLSLI